MSALCQHRDDCRLCGSTNVEKVFSLAPTPPANAFVSKEALEREQETFPLDVYFCNDCYHVQLLDVVDPRLLFENYVYVSGTSPLFVKHFEDYAADVIGTFSPTAGGLVVDIGSNDGTLLRAFKDRGMAVLGIDPARDIAQKATEAGIETLANFFSPTLAQQIKQDRGGASVITANNVFAHIDDMREVVEGIRTLLADDGVFVFEVSYLVDVYEKTLFDTIYHEHLAYHSVQPLVRFFNDNGMELIAANRVSSHGGSLRGVAQLSGGRRPIEASVDTAVAEEKRLGLDQVATLKAYAAKIDRVKRELGKMVRDMKAESKSIAAFGAPAKATTLLYHFDLGPEMIDFIVDDSPLKQGLYSPGQHIPVVPSQALYDHHPDAVIVLAWNFAEPIIAAHKPFLESGGRFIVPLPTIEIFDQ